MAATAGCKEKRWNETAKERALRQLGHEDRDLRATNSSMCLPDVRTP